MASLLNDFLLFLDRSPTVFHAAKEIVKALSKEGFTALKEKEKWELEPGKSYFVCRDEALIAAFRIPLKKPISATILASHTDSPALKIKPQPEILSGSVGQLGTECYGSPILHSWLDRDLILAGKISAIDKKNRECSYIVSLDEAPIIIPQLALHLDRTVNEKGMAVNKQDHLKPICSLKGKEHDLLSLLQKNYPFKKLLSFDLFLVPSQKSSFVGFQREMIASYRLDNLTSVYASLFALLHSSALKDTLQMAFFWDHEEVGSMSCLGADSTFGDQLLERIADCLQMGREDFFRLKSQSLCISSDLAHGLHPNFSDKYDPQNSASLGGGVVLKFNANQKYATSSQSAAPLILLAQKHQIPLQKSASRSDIASGSTVGSIMAARLGIASLDLGIASWAMHSARETIAAQDEIDLCSLLKAALDTPLRGS